MPVPALPGAPEGAVRVQTFLEGEDGRRLYADQPGALDMFRCAADQAMQAKDWVVAEGLFRETLRGCIALGEPTEATLAAHANVAVVLHRAGKLEEAVDVERRVLLGRRRALGEAHPTTVRTALTLALFLRKLRGDADEEAALLSAEATHTAHQGLPALRATREAGRLEGAFDLAQFFATNGQPGEAVPLLREVLQEWRESLGVVHPRTLDCARKLVGLFNRSGTVDDEAIEVTRVLLRDLLELCGECDEETLTSMHQLGCLLLNRTTDTSGPEFAEGLALLRRALPLMHAKLGATASETLECTSSLGNALVNLGSLSDAEPLLEAAATGFSQTLGESHDKTVDLLHSLSVNLSKQEKLERTEEVCWRVLRLRCATRKEPHSDTTQALSLLGGVLNQRGKFAVAAHVLRRALSAQAAMSGITHPQTENIRNGLLRSLSELNLWDEASVLLRTHVDAVLAAHADGDCESALKANDLIGKLISCISHGPDGAYEVIVFYLREALRVLRGALGPTHYLTRLGMRNLAALVRGEEGAALEAEAKGLHDICSNPACCSRDNRDSTNAVPPVPLRLKACAHCRWIRYCSTTCQRAHYKDHKPVCVLIGRRRKASPEPREAK
jgi:hypothetical protein